MPYPSQLKLDPKVEEDLKVYLDTELTNHLGERTVWIDEINDLQRDYKAKPSEENPTFPFVGASNMIVPLSAIAFESIHSRNEQKFNALKNHISIDIYDTEVSNLDKEVENYLDQEIFQYGNFVESFRPAMMELEKLGTGVAEATWELVTKKGYKTTSEGKRKSFEVVIKNGPSIKSVPITSFIMPFDCVDPQTARWCGDVFWFNPMEVQQAENDGMFMEGTVEKLDGFYEGPTSHSDDALKTTERMEEQENRKPSYPARLQFFKVYMSYCTDPEDPEENKRLNLPDGEDELSEICVIYHKDSRNIVACWYNWWEDLRRPYRYDNYFPVEFRWTGVGILEQNRNFQKEVSTIHRQTIDSGTIANSRMWKVKMGSTNVKEGEPIYPNKLWFVQEMDDIQPFANNEIYASSYNNENQAMIYSQQRTGVNEITLGMPGTGTPGTATDSQNRIQESGRKNDYTFSNIKRLADKLIHDTLCNIVQFGPNLDRIKYSPKRGDLEAFFKRPYEEFRNSYLCHVQMIDQNSNRILDRQTMTQFTGILQQYYTQIIPLVEQLASPQTPPAIADAMRTAIEGANAALVKVLVTFDERKPETYLIIPPNAPPPQPPPQPAGILGPSGSPAQPNNISNVSVNAPNVQSLLPEGAGRFFAGQGNVPTSSGL